MELGLLEGGNLEGVLEEVHVGCFGNRWQVLEHGLHALLEFISQSRVIPRSGPIKVKVETGRLQKLGNLGPTATSPLSGTILGRWKPPRVSLLRLFFGLVVKVLDPKGIRSL